MRILLLFSGALALHAAVEVRESASRVDLRQSPPQVQLAVINRGAAVTAPVEVTWIDTTDTVVNRERREVRIAPGESVVSLPLAIPTGDPAHLRLEYTVNAGGKLTTGRAALTRLSRDAFHIILSATPDSSGNGNLVHVRAQSLSTGGPVEGVSLEATVEGDGEPVKATTNRDGSATFTIGLPPGAEPDEDLDIDVEARLGDFEQSADVQFARQAPRTSLWTDKPIYQPGQTVHLRFHHLGEGRKPGADTELALAIRDPQRREVYTAKLTTSRFGVASADWITPPNLRLGTYAVVINDHDVGSVEVSRYDLPEFLVTAKLDREFYLPGETAQVEIGAQFTWGRPVTGAAVRLVRYTERRWDFNRQQWHVVEEDAQEAVLDATGKARLSIDATGTTPGLFEDLQFSASVTDPSTGRTEERRFDLRISAAPQHVYVRQTAPRRCVVTVSGASGEPARTSITIAGRTIKTDRLGHAAFPCDDLPKTAVTRVDGKEYEVRIADSARAPSLAIRPGRYLNRAGRPLEFWITAEEPGEGVLVLSAAGKAIEHRWLHWRKGSTLVQTFWRKEFAGLVNAALITGEDHDSTFAIYPGTQSLALAVQPSRAEYKPGEEAEASLALTAAGKFVAGVIGIAVVDTALDGRTRETDSNEDPLLEQLLNLDPEAPFPAELELAAELLTLPAQIFETGRSFRAAYPLRDASRIWSPAMSAFSLGPWEHLPSVNEVEEFLLSKGYAVDRWRDAWGQPYRIEVRPAGASIALVAESAGPDETFGTRDDFSVHWGEWHYFRAETALVHGALRDMPSTASGTEAALRRAGFYDRLDPWGNPYWFEHAIKGSRAVVRFFGAGPDGRRGTGDDALLHLMDGRYFAPVRRSIERVLEKATFPASDAAWKTLSESARLDLSTDPWGRPWRAAVTTQDITDKAQVLYTWAKYGTRARQQVEEREVRRVIHRLAFTSSGPDGIAGNADDFDVDAFYHSANELQPKPRTDPAPRFPNGGAIAGIVMDASEARVARAVIRAVRRTAGAPYVTESDDEGYFALTGLEPGEYDLVVEMPGFQQFRVAQIPVRRGAIAPVDVMLQIGSLSEMVQVESTVPEINTSAAQISSSAPTSTPRVREYFPETLHWQPEIETDSRGRARVRFKMADSITRWRIRAIASTLDGRVTEASAEVAAMQPFFLSHTPPAVLTEGDEITLPVIARSYLAKDQQVEVEVPDQPWLRNLGPSRREIQVAAGDTVAAAFRLRAERIADASPHRAVARGSAMSDAIDRPVAVRPAGRPVSDTVSRTGMESLDITIPQHYLPGTLRTRLTIYDNPAAQLLESMESILRRPYGCGEQTISSTYPHVLFLRLLAASRIANHPLEARSRRFLAQGLARLRGYRMEDGGYTYWGKGPSEDHLTAYALEFLRDAAEFTGVPEEDLEETKALVARRRSSRDGKILLAGDAYQLAEAATLAHSLGQQDVFERALDLLARAATTLDVAYWEVDGQTPFYGWGMAGRTETSARVLQALQLDQRATHKDLARSAYLYLMRNRDEHGIWWSGRATVQVLKALLGRIEPARPQLPDTLTVMVDGQPAATVATGSRAAVSGPMVVDLPANLVPGTHGISIPGLPDTAIVRWTASYAVPWTDKAGSSFVTFSKTEAQVNESITCRLRVPPGVYSGDMRVAEIGLPPGAEVDRQALAGQQIEVHADRVVLYFNGGVDVSFRFRPRFAMNALSAPTVIYSYYNPDAREFQAPARFVVRDAAIAAQPALPNRPVQTSFLR